MTTVFNDTERLDLTRNHLTIISQELRRRQRELKKRLERNSYDSKPGMENSVHEEIAEITAILDQVRAASLVLDGRYRREAR